MKNSENITKLLPQTIARLKALEALHNKGKYNYKKKMYFNYHFVHSSHGFCENSGANRSGAIGDCRKRGQQQNPPPRGAAKLRYEPERDQLDRSQS